MTIVSTARTGSSVFGDDAAGSQKAPTNIAIDFMVDASGRESRVARELELHGYAVPPVTELQSRLDYATILVRPASADWPQVSRRTLPSLASS